MPIRVATSSRSMEAAYLKNLGDRTEDYTPWKHNITAEHKAKPRLNKWPLTNKRCCVKSFSSASRRTSGQLLSRQLMKSSNTAFISSISSGVLGLLRGKKVSGLWFTATINQQNTNKWNATLKNMLSRRLKHRATRSPSVQHAAGMVPRG